MASLENYSEKEILIEILLTLGEIKNELAAIPVQLETIVGTNVDIMSKTSLIASYVSTIAENHICKVTKQ